MRQSALVFLMFLLLCCGAARGDAYSQLGEARIVDDSGRYYVVVQRKGGPVFASPFGVPWTLTMVACRPNSVPVVSASTFLRQEKDHFVRVSNPCVAVRAGDDVLGRCELAATPFRVDISSTGLGVATLDVWPLNRDGIERGERTALILISMKGEIRFRKNLAELFGADAEQLMRKGRESELVLVVLDRRSPPRNHYCLQGYDHRE